MRQKQRDRGIETERAFGFLDSLPTCQKQPGLGKPEPGSLCGWQGPMRLVEPSWSESQCTSAGCWNSVSQVWNQGSLMRWQYLRWGVTAILIACFPYDSLWFHYHKLWIIERGILSVQIKYVLLTMYFINQLYYTTLISLLTTFSCISRLRCYLNVCFKLCKLVQALFACIVFLNISNCLYNPW